MKQRFLFLFLVFVCSCKNDPNPEAVPAVKDESSASPAFDPVEVAGKDYFVDDQHSYIGFKIKYFGFSPVRGRFNTFNGSVFYDPEFPAKTQIVVHIDVKSINTGNERRDNDLITGDGWFNESEYPTISFRSKKTVMNEDGSFQMLGEFTMNGVTKEIAVPFERPTDISRDFAANEQVDYSAKLTLNRKDYNINGGDFWDTVMENGVTQLSDAVEIELDIHSRRADYLKRYEDLEAENIRKIVLDSFQQRGSESGMAALKKLQDAADPKLTSGALSTIGNTLLARKQFDDALTVFENGMQNYPDKTTYPIKTGIVHLCKNDKSNAIRHFEKALAMDPKSATAEAYLRLLQH